MNNINFNIHYGWNNVNGTFIGPYYNGYELDSSNNLSFVPDQDIPQAYHIQLPVQNISTNITDDEIQLRALNNWPIFLNPKRKSQSQISVEVPDLDSDNILSHINNSKIKKIQIKTSRKNWFIGNTPVTETVKFLNYFNEYYNGEFLFVSSSACCGIDDIRLSLEDAIKQGLLASQFFVNDNINQPYSVFNFQQSYGQKWPIQLYKRNTITNSQTYNFKANWKLKYNITINGKALYKNASVYVDNNNRSFHYGNDLSSLGSSEVEYEYKQDRSIIISNTPYAVTRAAIDTFLPGDIAYYGGAQPDFSDPNVTKIITSVKHYLVNGAQIHIYNPSLPNSTTILGRRRITGARTYNYYVKVIDEFSFALYTDAKLTRPDNFIRLFNDNTKPITYVEYLLLRGGDAEDAYMEVVIKSIEDNSEFFEIFNVLGENYINNEIQSAFQKDLDIAKIQNIVSSFINYGPLCELKSNNSLKYLFPSVIDYLTSGNVAMPEMINGKFRQDLLAQLNTITRDKNCLDTIHYITHIIDNIQVSVDSISLSSLEFQTNSSSNANAGYGNSTIIVSFDSEEPQQQNNLSFWRLKND